MYAQQRGHKLCSELIFNHDPDHPLNTRLPDNIGELSFVIVAKRQAQVRGPELKKGPFYRDKSSVVASLWLVNKRFLSAEEKWKFMVKSTRKRRENPVVHPFK